MAKNVSNDIGPVWLHISNENKSYLIAIRHWSNLKMATDGPHIWVKDFTDTQLTSVILKSIPFATFYIIKENLLFLEGKLLSERRMPMLLWTPIEKALPIASPDLNHNFFGIDQKVSVQLVASTTERSAAAMIVDMGILKQYILQASAVRLQGLQWCLIGSTKAFIYGTPLLPIEGISYWNSNGLLLPGGYDFELPILTNNIQQKLNAEKGHLIVFHTNGTYTSIPKENMKALSIASFRLSTENILS